MEHNDLQTPLSLNVTEYRTKTRYVMLNLILKFSFWIWCLQHNVIKIGQESVYFGVTSPFNNFQLSVWEEKHLKV